MFEWKKLLATVIGAVIAAIGKQIGLPEETINWLITVIVGYLIGQGIADFGKGRVVLEHKLATKGK